MLFALHTTVTSASTSSDDVTEKQPPHATCTSNQYARWHDAPGGRNKCTEGFAA